MLIQDERKSATILFVDIVDSTSLVAARDPEAALELLRPALTRLSDAVQRYGGVVNRVIGDGLMAMFGAPFTDEEHALGACCAALDMHAAMARGFADVRLRIGVHSGEVIVHLLRLPTTDSLDAVGEPVHVAARLQQEAPAGATWISDATFALVRGRVETRVVGPRSLRGFEHSIVVHLLQAADPSLSRLDIAGRRGLTPFVNRDEQTAALEAAYARAEAGHGCAVALAGDAGMGKSRLIREFVSARRGARVLEARCTRWRDDSGFHAIRVLTKRLFGLDATEDLGATQARLGTALGTQDIASADALAAVGVLHGIDPPAGWSGLTPNARRRRIIEGCFAVLLQAASDKTLLVIIDDVHWADSETEEVIERLLDGIGNSRLLLLLGWRAGYRPPGAPSPRLIEVALPPLPQTYARTLARSVLGQRAIDEAVVEQIAERTGGNPFFLEEAAAMPDLRELPPTARALLGARLDSLGREAKQLVEVVATVGEPASMELLAQVLDTAAPVRELGAIASELEQAGLLRIDGVGHSAQVACRHSLLQEAAYHGLTRVRRRELHARIAAAMERLSGERAAEEAEVLARHARLGEDWQAALRHARAAGARAASLSANTKAARFYNDALEALARRPDDTETLSLGIDLRFALRDPLFRLGHIAQLRSRLDEAASMAERLGDIRRLGQLYIFQSHHAWLAGDHASALSAADAASVLADAHDDAALRLRAVFQRGLAELGRGDVAASAADMAEVAAHAEDPALGGRFGLDAPLAAVALSYQARALTDLGKFEEAERAAKACAERAAFIQRPFTSIFAAIATGYVLLRRGAAPEARHCLAEAVVLCDRAEANLMRPVAQSFLGAAEIATGEAEAGLRHLEVAVRTAAAMGFLFQQPLRLGLLARALATAGRTEDAAAHAREASALAKAQGEPISSLVEAI